MHKKVVLPITVPDSDYCWNFETVCPHFDNAGGHPRCLLGLGIIDYDKEGRVSKSKYCKGLQKEKQNENL